jgi:hypothetical protein
MNLIYYCNTNLYEFDNRIGKREEIINYMISLDYPRSEILYALDDMEDKLNNVAVFGINNTFILSRHSNSFTRQ